ncbi:Ribosome biogenesis protein BOP1 homolog [Eumeta japonica]|uniref:Ribosome biogenesis protein BOP1 homolog n=1 Tax=Eumeta variegata TaxID=151549 RepID=A0A4C1X9R3_EUMVA|nr:Ribosome biogenesis protein BOP1 homolog [Eumeta japonica]
MPPFRSGLNKRKTEDNSKVEEKSSYKNANEVNLLGELKTEGDNTDSEHESDEQDSDEEQDGVLFDDSGDSILDEKDQIDEGGNESSELTDSEDNDDEEEENDSQSESDSGQESGLGKTQSGSSDDSDGTEETRKRTDQKLMKKKSKKDISKGKDTKIEKEKQTEDLKNNHNKNAVEKLQKQIDASSITVQKENAVVNLTATDVAFLPLSRSSGGPLPFSHFHLPDLIPLDILSPPKGTDEYESGDTSDEEEKTNTVGEVPMHWYNDYPHLGYDLDGRRIMKPPQRDQIDEFLKQCEDPDFWRTVRDPTTGQDVILSKEDLELIARIKESRVPNSEHNEFEPWIEWFTREVMVTPLRAFPEAKKSFLPSKSEQKKISKIVHALKMGWMKTRKQMAEERRAKKERQFYDLWGSTNEEEEQRRGIHKHIPAPRRPLPSHAESYNPPPEYLLDKREMKEWNKLDETPWKRKYTFLPTKYPSLREVPSYERFIRERFLRCLDLYLAPRAIKMRLTINPEDLVPKLPSPRDLQPFPTTEVLQFKGHTNLVRSADFDPTGQYVVSGSEDGTVKVWETSTGRCLRTIDLGTSVCRVAWTPSQGLSLIAAAAGSRLLLLNPGADIGAHRVAETTDKLLEEPPPSHDVVVDERTRTAAQWERVTPEQWVRGVRIAVAHFKPVTQVYLKYLQCLHFFRAFLTSKYTKNLARDRERYAADTIEFAWHGRGDYLVVTMPDGASRSVIVHQLSRRRSQLPFNKAKGLVQCALFHPTRPFLFVAVGLDSFFFPLATKGAKKCITHIRAPIHAGSVGLKPTKKRRWNNGSADVM